MFSVSHPTRHVMRTNKKFAGAVYDHVRALLNLRTDKMRGYIYILMQHRSKRVMDTLKKHRCIVRTDYSKEKQHSFLTKKVPT